MKKNIRFALCSLLFLLVGCDFQPHDKTFFAWEEDEMPDSRYLAFRPQKDSKTIVADDSSKIYGMGITNMYCHQKKNLKHPDGDLWKFVRNQDVYPIYVHRPNGRIDTLCCHKCSVGLDMGIGYISSLGEYKDFIVLEAKKAGKILGHRQMVDEERKETNILHLSLSDYHFEAQEKVFESKIADYWIANIHTTDIYGPFNLKNLKQQMKELGIPIPMQLKGMRDYYAWNHYTYPDGKLHTPKNGKKREGTLIR